jgi:hypothetical protein
MTAKKKIKSDPAFAAAIARVQPALAAWRQQRKHREPVPKALWRAMAALARAYGVCPVAQALSVNYTALKRHVAASPLPQAGGTGPLPAGFVEVPVTAWPSAPRWVIELEDGGGCKLTLRLAPGDGSAALALAQGLWRHRA